MLNVSLQQNPNPASSGTAQGSAPASDAEPDPRLAARIQAWLAASNTTIVVASSTDWGFVRKEAYKEIVLSSSESVNHHLLYAVRGVQMDADVQVLEWIVPVDDPAYHRAVFLVAMILAHACCLSIRMCLVRSCSSHHGL